MTLLKPKHEKTNENGITLRKPFFQLIQKNIIHRFDLKIAACVTLITPLKRIFAIAQTTLTLNNTLPTA
jgi:hypothetical protein